MFQLTLMTKHTQNERTATKIWNSLDQLKKGNIGTLLVIFQLYCQFWMTRCNPDHFRPKGHFRLHWGRQPKFFPKFFWKIEKHIFFFTNMKNILKIYILPALGLHGNHGWIFQWRCSVLVKLHWTVHKLWDYCFEAKIGKK